MSWLVYFVVIFFLVPLAIAAVIGAPPVWVPKRAARLMIRESHLSPTEKGCDLGAGIGRVIAVGVKEFHADMTGIEYVPALRWFGKLFLLAQGIEPYRLRRGNFYTESFTGGDVYFCFLMPKTLARLKEKFERELKPGTRVVSYAFPVPGWSPERSIKEEGIGRVYFYRR